VLGGLFNAAMVAWHVTGGNRWLAVLHYVFAVSTFWVPLSMSDREHRRPHQ
jgi:hypothetical protein